MAKEEAGDVSWFGELFRARLYKPAQGRIARQVTAAALLIACAAGAWQALNTLRVSSTLADGLTWATALVSPAESRVLAWKPEDAADQARARGEFEAWLAQDAHVVFQAGEADKPGARVSVFDPSVGRLVLSERVEAPGWLRALAAYGVPGLFLLLGSWFAFRIVNYAPFADFLTAVEAEMSKVSWPSRLELQRSSIVVVFTIFFLTAILFLFDVAWVSLFQEVLQVLAR